MTIDGLTEEDVVILDEMWAIDSREELKLYLNGLSSRKRQKAITLLEMVTLSSIDDNVNAMDKYPEAEMMLKSIMR